MGIVVGTTLAIGGYACGWILALSVPEGVPRIPILIAMTGIGSTVGTFIAWNFNIDGGAIPSKRIAGIVLAVTLIGALVGGQIGFDYGAKDPRHRVRRYPEIQGTIWGTVGGANLMQTACQVCGMVIAAAYKRK